MPDISTTNLWSTETINRLVTEPLFSTSVALDNLRRLTTSATTVSLPSVQAGSAAFVSELEPIGDANVSASMLTVRPRKVAALQVVSRESVDDAAAATIVGQAIVAGLASAIDKSLFGSGDGAEAPDGLPGMLGHQDVSANPSTITDLDAVAEAIANVEDAGGSADVLFCSPAVWEHLSTLKVEDGSAQPLLHQPGALAAATQRSVYGLRVVVSRHVPDTAAWVLDANRVLAVVRTPVELAISEHAEFAKDAVVVRATARVEFAAPDEDVVCLIGHTGS